MSGSGSVWACHVCTLENAMGTQECEVCGTARKPHVAPYAPSVPALVIPSVPASPAPAPAVESVAVSVGAGDVPPTPRTMEEFVAHGAAGQATIVATVVLADGTQLQFDRSMDASSLRQNLATLLGMSMPPGAADAGEAGAAMDSGAMMAMLGAALGGGVDVNGSAAASGGRDGGGGRDSGRGSGQPPNGIPGGADRSSSSADHNDPRRRAPFTINARDQQQQLSGAAGMDTDVFSMADPSFKRSDANAGGRGGEAYARRDRQMEMGPSQIPANDVVPLSTLAEQQGDDFVDRLMARAQEALAAGQGAAGGGVRANDPTQGVRLHEDTSPDSFERSVYIDQDRRGALRYDVGAGGGDIDLSDIPVAREEILKGGQNMKVAYEVAAVQGKIKNMARVAGERVAELDHYVESVVTPKVELKLIQPDGQASGDMDVFGNAQVAAMNVRRALEGLMRSALLDGSGARVAAGPGLPPVHVVGDADPSPFTPAYAQLCWSLLEEVHGVLGWPAPSPDRVVLYHMATMRADELVVAYGDTTGSRDGDTDLCGQRLATGVRPLFFNVLGLQQSTHVMRDTDGTPICIKPDAWHEVLPYYVTRLCNAARRGVGLTAADASHVGVFDGAVRRRLGLKVRSMDLSEQGQHCARRYLAAAAHASYRPRPVSGELLRPAH